MLRFIYATSFLFSFQSAITAYLNSSFLSSYFSGNLIGVFFTASSIVSLLILSFLPKILSKVGNRNFSTGLLTLGAFSALLMSLGAHPLITAVAFIASQITLVVMVPSMDIFIEHYSKQEDTGKARGIYLTIINVAWVISPFLATRLFLFGGFSELYAIVAIVLALSSLVLYHSSKGFADKKYMREPFWIALKKIRARPNLARISTVNFILQFFYSWMVVYTPLYLTQTIGLGWDVIGIIFTIMLLPFVLFQLPLGRLADKRLGEKEILITGIFIMGISTLVFAFSHSFIPLIIGAVLFATRTGASFIEIMAETYFFKNVNEEDAEMISLFRDSMPIAYLIGPLLGGIVIGKLGYEPLYIILSVVVFLSLIPAFKLKDTK